MSNDLEAPRRNRPNGGDVPYRLIPDAVSRDTVQALQQLLEGAQNGDVIGIAFAAAIRGRRYIVDMAGALHREPTLARGMVRALDDCLSDLVHSRDPNETR